ncbi:MAG: Metal dependent phosphohydrolase [Candidatus Daviesbacteria bacterium GW2011_GWA1_41_61]|uniref:Metal dependent phosphohydrolase n=1 Tax=Candidatus Daviesbacteria bacterium GW2011_GWA2_40_9 TaxID=1618424 RepID=A0A0G0TZ66_9BACT|nr:MAG: Metal dependent phosphohydrolase [Candidatus Daviesbacteria bacterium GW2011_GWC1_40_9]KKR82179.1 MAG: Metal dependent phosphohydrolase [Candidatus Daviesbacteria bacterium GW2011_GWA2_40_9]KKR93629.1 MAG: Metal dependent phosphohydrolase [Candidatus Daviesbacteria bacterium GW2011_GWB1_41_15]KKS14820.1 MAG: Metal dependent phosphohydrolase [Candidatus Daviesbacteria bacterium GW2011_GWA1_41_61]
MTEAPIKDIKYFPMQWHHLKNIVSPMDETKFFIITLPGGRKIRADLAELTPPRKVENKEPTPKDELSPNFSPAVAFMPLLPRSVEYIQRLRQEGWELSWGDMAEILLQTQAIRDVISVFHQRRVEAIAGGLAEVLGYTGEALENVRLAGLLHDIGKDGVPEEIVKKKGKLTEEEWNVMDRHPTVSGAVLQALNFKRQVIDAVRQHHKDCLGNGYPKTISVKEITQEGQIIKMADEIDASSNNRGYPREIKTPEELWAEFIEGMKGGKKYLKRVVYAVRKAYQTKFKEWEEVQRIFQPQPELLA